MRREVMAAGAKVGGLALLGAFLGYVHFAFGGLGWELWGAFAVLGGVALFSMVPVRFWLADDSWVMRLHGLDGEGGGGDVVLPRRFRWVTFVVCWGFLFFVAGAQFYVSVAFSDGGVWGLGWEWAVVWGGAVFVMPVFAGYAAVAMVEWKFAWRARADAAMARSYLKEVVGQNVFLATVFGIMMAFCIYFAWWGVR